jgi:hexosaminidase
MYSYTPVFPSYVALTHSLSPPHTVTGLLVDTANHFIPVETLQETIELMSRNRLNVLHWHIIDSYSFPLVLESLPILAVDGAWNGPATTYNRSDVQGLVEFARQRGVRIVAELEVPGHAYSWGLAFPNITVSCPPLNDTDIGPINTVPLDPTRDETYTVVQLVVQEMASLFPDAFLHVGGDEVQTECWAASQVRCKIFFSFGFVCMSITICIIVCVHL